MSDEEKDCAKRLREFETQMRMLHAWLRSELGYNSESEGNVKRLMNETHEKATEAIDLLRGTGSDTGIIGKVDLLFRSWYVLLSLVTALGGYIVRMVTES